MSLISDLKALFGFGPKSVDSPTTSSTTYGNKKTSTTKTDLGSHPKNSVKNTTYENKSTSNTVYGSSKNDQSHNDTGIGITHPMHINNLATNSTYSSSSINDCSSSSSSSSSSFD